MKKMILIEKHNYKHFYPFKKMHKWILHFKELTKLWERQQNIKFKNLILIYNFENRAFRNFHK